MLELILAAATAATATLGPSEISSAEGRIAADCGVTLPISIAWADFGGDQGGRRALAHTGLGFLETAFAQVCADKQLKAQVAKQVSKVVLRQAYGATEPVVYIDKRTLFVEYLWVENDPPPSPKDIAREVVSRLRGEAPDEP